MREYRIKSVLKNRYSYEIVYHVQTKWVGLWWTVRRDIFFVRECLTHDAAVSYIRMQEKRDAFVITYTSFK